MVDDGIHRTPEDARLNDPAAFTHDDLTAALNAVGGYSYLADWGRAILTALRQCTPHEPLMALDLAENTARLRGRDITPFDGMLEAPEWICDLYAAHRDRLRALKDLHADVLGELQGDIVDRILRGPDQPITWGDLARHGADRAKPDPPPYDEFDNF